MFNDILIQYSNDIQNQLFQLHSKLNTYIQFIIFFLNKKTAFELASEKIKKKIEK